MFKRIIHSLCIALVLGGFSLTADAAAYIKLEGIRGESLPPAAEGEWIEILSVDQTVNRTGVRTKGETTLGDIVCVRELDKSSVSLSEILEGATGIDRIEVLVTDEEGHTLRHWQLGGAQVTSFQLRSAGSQASEQITMNFERIRDVY